MTNLSEYQNYYPYAKWIRRQYKKQQKKEIGFNYKNKNKKSDEKKN
jgi:hypothetical protein